MDRTDLNLPQRLFLEQLETMKQILTLGEAHFGRGSQDYRQFKSRVMRLTYDGLRRLFTALSDQGVVTPCDCGANLKDGWSPCPQCSGSGWRGTPS